MKHLQPLTAGTLLLLAVLATPAFGQSAYNGLPLLKANSSNVNVRIGNAFVKGLWTIEPEFSPNTLRIQVREQMERLVFYTDIDSAAYEVRPAQSKQFYVLLNSKHYVLAEVKGFKLESDKKAQETVRFLNIEKPRSKTFGTLWEKHHVGDVVNDINDYADKVTGTFGWAKEKLFGPGQ